MPLEMAEWEGYKALGIEAHSVLCELRGRIARSLCNLVIIWYHHTVWNGITVTEYNNYAPQGDRNSRKFVVDVAKERRRNPKLMHVIIGQNREAGASESRLPKCFEPPFVASRYNTFLPNNG